jgi:dolichol kinase
MIQLIKNISLNFIITQIIMVITYYIIAFVGGKAVKSFGIKVNYTRKINHFALFFLPMLLGVKLPFNHNILTIILSFIFGVISLAIYIKPVRERISLINTAFMSFDRPEDRPHTLLWLTTQIMATCLVVIPMVMYLYHAQKLELLFLPALINGIGDGLAEPVGIRFGKHSYSTRALFSKKRYKRTIEGSACVFITSAMVVLLLSSNFNHCQFISAFIFVPVIMTLAEAFAPHTWDSPVLYAVAGILVFLILQI